VQRQNRLAIAALAAIVAAAGGGGIHAGVQNGMSVPLASNQWNTFIADVTVRAGRIAADGRPAGVATAPMQYRWERSQSGAGWKTVMTIADRKLTVGSGDTRHAVENPFAVARIEDDEDGSPVRIYGKDGRRLRPPTIKHLQQWTDAGLRQFGSAVGGGPPDALPAATGPGTAAQRPFTSSAERGWLSAFVATPQDRPARRSRLQQQFVRRGQMRGLDRFTALDGDKTLEVLANAEAVPLEVNTLRDGRLLSHTTITYQLAADGSLVRRSVHAEQLLSASTGERSVIDTDYLGIRVERRW